MYNADCHGIYQSLDELIKGRSSHTHENLTFAGFKCYTLKNTSIRVLTIDCKKNGHDVTRRFLKLKVDRAGRRHLGSASLPDNRKCAEVGGAGC